MGDPTILSANMSAVRIGLGISASTASFIASLSTLMMAATVLAAGTLPPPIQLVVAHTLPSARLRS